MFKYILIEVIRVVGRNIDRYENDICVVDFAYCTVLNVQEGSELQRAVYFLVNSYTTTWSL